MLCHRGGHTPVPPLPPPSTVTAMQAMICQTDSCKETPRLSRVRHAMLLSRSHVLPEPGSFLIPELIADYALH